jgi:hypothetical protein
MRVLGVIAAFGLCLAPASVLAAPQDVASTHAYIQAYSALTRARAAKFGAIQAKVDQLNSRLARECPLIGTGSLQDEASQRVTAEVAAALWSIEYGTDAGPIRTFVNAVKRLRFSNRAITRVAQKYANDLRVLSTIPLPNLCGDVGTWKANGFQTLPATTVAIDDRVEGIEPKPLSQQLLAPYERGSDASLMAQAVRQQLSLEEREFTTGLHDLLKVLATLALNE